MGFRFRRTIKIMPGIKLNLGKRGVSISAGVRGASLSFGKRGVYANTGLPGTGISYRTRIDSQSKAVSEYKSTVKSKPGSNSYSIKVRFNDDGTIDFLSDDGSELPASFVKKIREQNSESLERLIEEYINQANNDYEACLSVYKQTPSLNANHEYPVSPPECPELIKIGFFKNIFGLAREDKIINNRLLEQYDSKLKDWTSRNENWPITMQKANEGDIDAMSEMLGEILSRIAWPKETLVNYDFGNDGKTLILDIDLPEIQDMPKTFLSRAARGVKVNIKKLSDTQIKHDYAMLIHGISFRMIGECFSAMQNLEEITFSGFTQRVSDITGMNNDEYVLSIRVTKEQWAKIDLRQVNLIDPIDSLAQFELIRDMKRNWEMKKIEPLAHHV